LKKLQVIFKKLFIFLSGFRNFLVNADTRFLLGLIGLIVGISSGFTSLALNFGLHHFSTFFSRYSDHIFIIIIPALGIFLTVILLKYLIKDFGSHGVPDVIYAISLKGGKLSFRSFYSKLLGSLVTISTGGSAGPEAPVAVSGAAIGSNFARFLKTNETIRIAVTGAGVAGAIAAIFNAPITGIVFTMEVIIGEWTSLFMLPVAISSVAGTIISRMFHGNQIPFEHRLFSVNINDILASLGLAVLCAVSSILFIRILKKTTGALAKYFKNDLIKSLAGGVMVGIIAFMFPYVRGEGYDFIREMISGKYQAQFSVVLLIVIFKIIATSLTLGSGGAGGVFAPSLVIGSTTGLLFFSVISNLVPQLHINDSSLFSLVGMSGVISGTLHAPLTGIFLIIEITNGYDAILPLLLVSFLTSAIVKQFEKHSIYHHELVKKDFLHRPRTDGRILTEIKPMELLEKDLITIEPNLLLKEIIPVIQKSTRNYFPVVDKKSGHFLGMVYFHDLKELIFNNELLNTLIVEEVMHTDLSTVSLADSLIDILKKFDTSNSWSLPVVENGKFRGLISKATMLDLYRKELKVQTDY
jgi:CIC family chloride channel protein